MNNYVYLDVRNDTGTPFYVGYGKLDRVKRISRTNRYHTSVRTTIGITRKILAEDLPEKKAKEMEIYFIALYRKCGFKLANHTNGGEGVSGAKFGPQTKSHKIKKSFYKNWVVDCFTKDGSYLGTREIAGLWAKELGLSDSKISENILYPEERPSLKGYVFKRKFTGGGLSEE